MLSQVIIRFNEFYWKFGAEAPLFLNRYLRLCTSSPGQLLLVSAVWGIGCKGVKQSITFLMRAHSGANAGTASQLLPPLQGERRREIQQEKGREKKPWKNETNTKAGGAQERIKGRKKYYKKESSSIKKPVSVRTEKGNRATWWNKQKKIEGKRKKEKCVLS